MLYRLRWILPGVSLVLWLLSVNAELLVSHVVYSSKKSIFDGIDVVTGDNAIVKFSSDPNKYNGEPPGALIRNDTVYTEPIMFSVMTEPRFKFNCALRADDSPDTDEDKTKLVRKVISEYFRPLKIAEMLRSLSKCYRYTFEMKELTLCLNGHARLRTYDSSHKVLDDVILGVFGSGSAEEIISKSDFLHNISETGSGISYIVQYWEDGNLCPDKTSNRSTLVYLGCNEDWQGIYSFYEISACKYAIQVYVSELCDYRMLNGYHHDYLNKKLTTNTYYCEPNLETPDLARVVPRNKGYKGIDQIFKTQNPKPLFKILEESESPISGLAPVVETSPISSMEKNI